MIYIFFIILFLLLVPIKINIHFIYHNKKVILFLWNHEINLSKFNKKKRKKTSSDTENLSKNNKKSFMSKYKKFKLYHKDLKDLLPINTLEINLEYGFEEPNITAITYGFKDLFNSYLINTLNYFLIIKHYSINIIPTLKEKNLSLSINSIIYISIGKLIFIGSKLLLKKYKGDLQWTH